MNDVDMDLHAIKQARSRQWPKAFFAGCAILICGIVIGSAATLMWEERRGDERPGPPGPSPEMFLERLRQDLAITDVQAQQILPYLVESHSKLEAIRLQTEPRVRAEMESLDAKIGSVLDPAQKDKWTKRVAEMRERMHKFGPEGPKEPPPPNEGPKR
jgi:hypothetical protein